MEAKNLSRLVTFAAVLAVAGGCSRSSAPKGAPPAPVLTALATTTNVPVRIDPPPIGHVEPILTVSVRPQVGGIISAVNFQEGQEVKKGDSLFTLDARPMQAALEQAKANLQRDTAQMENSKIQFDRDEKLFAQHLISQDEYDTSKAAMDGLAGTVAADRAAVTNAALNLEYTDIRAPIDGRTGSLQFHIGNVVKSPDDVLVTINQIHPIYATFGVPEQFLPEIKRELRAHSLKVAAAFENMDAPPEGELTFIDNSVDATTGKIQLKATFPNEDGALWPGQFVTLTLTLSELTNAVVVPSQAVQTGQNGDFIYVVKPDQTVEERPVTIGVTYDGKTVVQSGLKTGERVVTDGQLRLAPGVKVSEKTNEK
jgi:multidrug efflux system membrane fusion protein